MVLLDFTIGRKGLLNYLRSLSGSNIVKIVPDGSGASASQATAKRQIKVVCGATTSHISDKAWIKEPTASKGTVRGGTPLTVCEVRVSSSSAIVPNIGTTELAEALNRVLPFTAKEESRPVLGSVFFVAKEGKLHLVGADGFRLATIALNFEGEGQALIASSDLRGIPNALKRAKRARISFEAKPKVDNIQDMILETDLVSYRFNSVAGSYPDYEPLMPTTANTVCHFDTIEAMKALGSLKALVDLKQYAVDLAIGEAGMGMSDPDSMGQADIRADVEGQPVKVRFNGGYLSQALRACGGMVDLQAVDGNSAVLLRTDGYRVLLMPMAKTDVASKPKVAVKAEARAEVAGQDVDVVAQAEAIAGAVAPAEPVKVQAKRHNQPKPTRKAKALARA